MVRRIRGLRWARRLDSRPKAVPNGRPRGIKALGVRYERAFAQVAHELEHGSWFEFEDMQGHGFAQTDFMTKAPDGKSMVILETKSTWVLEGHIKIEEFYGPIVEEAMRTRVLGSLVVCKNLTKETRGWVSAISEDLDAALYHSSVGYRSVLQWLPGTPLRALAKRGVDRGGVNGKINYEEAGLASEF
jgi:hypothetical protein